MRRITVTLAALLCVLTADVAQAETGVLVDHVPTGATPAVVIAVCKAALTNREWTVTAAGADWIEAKLNHKQADAKIRISFSDWRLLYEGDALSTFRTGPLQQVSMKRKTDIPDRWITYLRRDIATALATVPDTPR